MGWKEDIRPLPAKFGVGFMTPEKLEDEIQMPWHPPLRVKGYRYEQVGRYHNYHFTPDSWCWPVVNYGDGLSLSYVIDGFSPNLNKQLHVGHLRNLAIAASLKRFLPMMSARFVAMLGASLGVKKAALEDWKFWTGIVQYDPKIFYDITLPDDVVPLRHEERTDPEDYEQPYYWDGPNGPVIVKRSDGKPLYTYHDLAFAAEAGPTHYITGHEQREHFDSLGLGDKHLPMGLVLGADNKKLKSRTGDAMLAREALELVMEKLEGSFENRQSLAWNILAWNLLQTARETNVKFEVERWVTADAPGMYISYAYARVVSALKKANCEWCVGDFKKIDIQLLGVSEYFHYYENRAIEAFDPAPLAHYAHELARVLTSAYSKEKIDGGRTAFQWAMNHAVKVLGKTMEKLTMFPLAHV